MKRTINLPTAIFIIIGYVVGATIFILPGELTSLTGPGVFLAYLLAAIPAVFFCFVVAQLGATFPTSGGPYVLISEVLSPFLGFIYLWVSISLAIVVIPLIAVGFSQYISTIFSGVNIQFVSSLCILSAVIVNCFGLSAAGILQNIFVIILLLSLVIFGSGGMYHGDPELLSPLLPFGYSGLLLAASMAYFSYAGVIIIAEIAGEIKDPDRNIPLAIGVSFIVISIFYVVVPLALVQLGSTEELSRSSVPVIFAAEKIFSPFFVNFIAVGSLVASATSINGIVMGVSRDVFKGAKNGWFPRFFHATFSVRKTPIAAIILVGSFSFFGVFLGKSVSQYAQIAVFGLLLIQVLISIAIWRLPNIHPDKFLGSNFKLGKKSLSIFCMGSVFVSVFFMGFLVWNDPMLGVVSFIFLTFGFLYLIIRKRAVSSNVIYENKL